ncbi:MAG: ATP-binding cassette domain-containing protein [Oscillospiraceae bacterium]|nr:ATP-binding cassette domain-containing protein [Oscillospiraceae bacterium]
MSACNTCKDTEKTGVLHIKKAVKRFGGKTVVNVEDIRIGTHCIEGLIGPNGAGKSTLINLMTQKLSLTEGEIIYYRGDEAINVSSKNLNTLAKLNLVRSNQIIQDFASLTIVDSMILANTDLRHEKFYKLFNDKEVREAAQEKIDFYLDYFHFDFPEGHALSAGEKKLLDIIRCLILNPKFLLLDEPTAGLPQDQSDKVIDLLQKKTAEEDMCVLIVEHNLDLIWRVCDYIHFMADGQILIQGTPDEIKGNETVNKKYIGEESNA